MIMLYFWFFALLAASTGIRALYRIAHTPVYKWAFAVVAFVGVFVHEVAHYIVSVIVRGNPGEFKVKFRSEDKTRISPHGSVGNPEFERQSFLQAFAISFAPLLVSTLLFMFGLDVIFHIQTELIVNVIAFVFCVSLVIGSRPSGQDLKVVGYAYQNDPRYSGYQIFLLLLSGVLVWLFVDVYFFVLPFEVMYYAEYMLIIVAFYFGLKGVFWSVGKVSRKIAKKLGKAQVSSPKFLTRKRRFKHIKDPNEREVQW